MISLTLPPISAPLIAIAAVALAVALIATQGIRPSSPATAAPKNDVTLPEGGNMHWFIRTQELARQYGLGDMFVRQIKQESHFRDDIISGQTVSWAGAVGIAQIVPWMHPEVDPLDPEASLHYAARLMIRHIVRYQGDRAKALAAYNAGPGTVDWAVETCGREAWRDCLPDETKEYLANVYVPGTSTPAPTRTPQRTHPPAQKTDASWLAFLDVVRDRR